MLLWTRQFGTSSADELSGVSVAGDGWVAVTGFTGGTLPGQTSFGSTDSFVQRYDGDGGVLLWTRQFGGVLNDGAYGVSVGSDGRVMVAGSTDYALPNQSNLGGTDAFLVTFSAFGAPLRTRQFGTVGSDSALAVSSANDGSAVVAGVVGDTLPGQVSQGAADAFLRRYENP
jgi:hypothetical protein